MSESTPDREERKTGETTGRSVPNYSPCFQFDPEATAQTNTGDALTKNKEEKRKIRNQERHTKTKSERWRDFFNE